jgi:hypothetical protein
MGFIITSEYSLFNLPPMKGWYVSINGEFSVTKQPKNLRYCSENDSGNDVFKIIYTIYYSMGRGSPVITQSNQILSRKSMTLNENIYKLIYDEIKKGLTHNDDIIMIEDEGLKEGEGVQSKIRYDQLRQNLYKIREASRTARMEKLALNKTLNNPIPITLSGLDNIIEKNDEITKTIKNNPLSPDRPEGVDYIPTPIV